MAIPQFKENLRLALQAAERKQSPEIYIQNLERSIEEHIEKLIEKKLEYSQRSMNEAIGDSLHPY